MFKKFSAALVAAFFMSAPALAQAPQAPLVAQAWLPAGNISGGVSVTSSTSNTALPAAGDVAWVCNTGSIDAYLAFGGSSVVATTAGSSLLKSQTCAPYAKRINSGTLATFIAAITASSTTTLSVETGIGTPPASVGNVANQTPGSAGTFSGSVTNPTSTLTMTSATTAYSAGQFIANSATAGSVVNPSFAILNAAGGAAIPRVRLASNDTTSTAWVGVTIQVDLWSAAPTWTNGDRAAWLPATGSASHLASYSCTMPTPVWGDGLATECLISVNNFAAIKLASGTTVYWSLKAVGASGVTGASKVFTLTAELVN